MSKATVIAIGAVLLLVSVAAAAETYRWVDAEGELQYGDRPVQGAEPVQVKTAEAGDATTVTENDEAQSVRAQHCELARKRLNEYEESDVIFQEDEFGRRQELGGEERVQLIVRARRDVRTFCAEQEAVTEAPAAAETGSEPASAEPAAESTEESTSGAPAESPPAEPAAAAGSY